MLSEQLLVEDGSDNGVDVDFDSDGSLEAGALPSRDSPVPEDAGWLWTIGKIWRVSWPQTVVILARTSISVTDSAVVGRLGVDELAATAFAVMVIQLSACVVWAGAGDGLITLTSQAMGAGNRHLAGVWLLIALAASACFAVPIGVLWMFIGEVLRVVRMPGSEHENANVVRLASRFGRLSALWLLPDVATTCFCQWLNGLDCVVPTIPIHLFSVAFNLLGNIVLVHGVRLGGQVQWAGLGFDGSPLATTLTTVVRLVLLVTYMRSRVPKGVFGGFRRADVTRARFATFFAQFLPNSAAAVLEQSQIVVLTLLVARFGEAQLAAHSCGMELFELMSALIYGMSEGGSMAIGTALGKGRPEQARLLGKYLLAAMTLVGAVVALLFLALSPYLGRIFSNDEAVVRYTAQLCVLMGVCYMLLSVTFASYTMLQGQGRPERAVVSSLVGVWLVGVPSAYVIAFPLGQGFLGVWEGSTLGYAAMTVAMVVAVYHSDWEKLSVAARERSEVGGADGAVFSGAMPPSSPHCTPGSPRHPAAMITPLGGCLQGRGETLGAAATGDIAALADIAL